MEDALRRKLAGRPPAELDAGEEEALRGLVRRAMAVTLERPEEQIADEARVFDDLGLDSIDVFDLLDQLADALDVPVELDGIPEEMIHGAEGLTFRQFADAIVAYFQQPPPSQEAP